MFDEESGASISRSMGRGVNIKILQNTFFVVFKAAFTAMGAVIDCTSQSFVCFV